MSKPSLHGHTKIELFNAGSGKLEEVVEDDNTLTGALAEIFQGIGNFSYGSAIYQYLGGNAKSADGISYSSSSYSMAHWFGGMLAFSQDQDENYPLMNKQSDIVAAGVYGYLNGGSNQVRGSYNSTESVIDLANRSLTYVYDFATNQGNGTIRSVCLVPRWGGFMNEGLARTVTGINSLPLDEFWQPVYYSRGGAIGGSYSDFPDRPWTPALGWLGQGISYHAHNWNSVAPQQNYYYLNNSSYMGIGTFYRVLEIDPDNNWILRAKVELSAGTVYLTFERFPLAGNEVDVWLGNGVNSYSNEAEYSNQIELGSALYNHITTLHLSYDYELRKLYIISHPLSVRNTLGERYSGEQYSHRNGISASDSFKVWEIDVDPVTTTSGDTYTVTEYTIPNNTNTSIVGMATMWNYGMNHLLFHCYEGFIYVFGPISNQPYYWSDGKSYNIYKIELANPTNVVQIDTNVTSFAPVYAIVNDAHDGRMYLNFGSGAMRVLNTRTNQLYAYEELNANDYGGFQFTPIRNHIALGCSSGHLIGVRPNVLMTVNNITAVTKTSAQTMKISYTISG